MCAQTTKPTSSVPAGIERTLCVLQQLAQHPDGLRHSELVHLCGSSKTAITRVLSHLLQLTYISHSKLDHRYRTTALAHQLSPIYSPQLDLLQRSQQQIQELAVKTEWSLALIYWTGEQAIGLTRIIAANNCQLQEPGHITRGVVDNPYYVFFLSQLQWRRIHRDKEKSAPSQNHAWYVSESTRLKQDGYTMSDNGNKIRLAAPIYRGQHCIGALQLGHAQLKIAHKNVGKQLAKTCADISADLGI